MKFINFTESWLNELEKEGSVKQATITTYKRRIESYINPYFEQYDIEDIDEEKIKEFHDELKRKQYKEQTIKNYINLLKQIKYSVKKREKITQMKTEKFLTEQQFREFIKYLKNNHFQNEYSKYTVPIFISALTGMLSGELSALRGEDIDLEKGIINVRNVASRVSIEDEKSRTEILITETSHPRELKISDWIVKVLKTYIEEYMVNKKCFLVTGTIRTKDPRNMLNELHRIGDQLGFEINFKIMQSTFIRNCLNQNVSLEEIAYYIGTTSERLKYRGYEEVRCKDLIAKVVQNNFK